MEQKQTKKNKLRIFKYREGFAMNSSSTHGIVMLPPGDKVYEDIDDYYGWSDFTLTSPKSKLHYIMSLLARDEIPWSSDKEEKKKNEDEFFNKIYEEFGVRFSPSTFFGYVDEKVDPEYEEVYSVDHQSSGISFPSNFQRDDVNYDFARDLISYIVNNDRIVIHGGNDNDSGHYLDADRNQKVKGVKYSWGGVARKEGDGWTVFYPYTGDKTRISFSDSEAPEKARSPELVDLKITDNCDLGCSFCYQGSVPNQKHADFEYIKKIVDKLSENECFEIAIGGGEPTTHPQFAEICKYIKSKNIVPNFTTKTLRWLKEPWAESILKSCGGFALSVASTKDMENFLSELGYYRYKPKYDWQKPWKLEDGRPNFIFNFQHVVGVAGADEFKKILEHDYDARITLLGYKDDNRGSLFKPIISSSEALKISKKVAKKKDGLTLGIDTKLARDWEKYLKEIDPLKVFYETEEGKFSMYIDAVEKTAEKCSYGKREKFYLNSEEDIIPSFKKM